MILTMAAMQACQSVSVLAGSVTQPIHQRLVAICNTIFHISKRLLPTVFISITQTTSRVSLDLWPFPREVRVITRSRRPRSAITCPGRWPRSITTIHHRTITLILSNSTTISNLITSSKCSNSMPPWRGNIPGTTTSRAFLRRQAPLLTRAVRLLTQDARHRTMMIEPLHAQAGRPKPTKAPVRILSPFLSHLPERLRRSS